MSDDYPSAVAALMSNTPLTPLQYISLMVSQTEEQIRGTDYLLDNSGSVWDNHLSYGPLMLTSIDSSSQTLTFYHALYVGAQQSTTIAQAQLPPETVARLMEAAARDAAFRGVYFSPEQFPGWALIIIGIGLLAAGLALEPLTLGASSLLITAGWVVLAVGVVVTTLQAYVAFVSPSISEHTCNSAGNSCCTDYVDHLTGSTTVSCVNCPSASSSSGCTTSNTPLPTGIPNLGLSLAYIALGVGAVAAVGIGGYAAYKYVANKPRPGYTPRPSTSAPPSPPLSKRSGLLPRAYRETRSLAGRAYEGAKRTLIGS